MAAVEANALRVLQAHFDDALKAWQEEVEGFERDFGSLKLELDVNKPISRTQLRKLQRRYIEQMATAKSPEELRELERLASLTKVSHIQAVSNSMKLILIQATSENVAVFNTGLLQLMQLQFTNQFKDIASLARIEVGFGQMSRHQLDAILKTGYNGKSYSSKLWYDCNQVAKVLEQKMPSILASGVSTGEASEILADTLKTSQSNAARLFRTEGTFVMGQADRTLYTQLGISEYEFVATLDSRTSEICSPLDGSVFALSGAVPGKNYPPMHPNCRSTTVPMVDVSDLDVERFARVGSGRGELIKPITYSEWSKTLP